MVRLSSLARCSPRERSLLLQASAWLLLARVALLLPLASARRLLDRLSPLRPPRGDVSATEIGRAVERAGCRLLGDRSCLPQALAGRALLHRHGHSGEIRFGVNREEQPISAHAWVESGGRIVIGGVHAEAYRLLRPTAEDVP
ncbi:MAG TPA: lasso peptide biosynthesis B2 protein [Armatimonadota bacterium]|nr:lasso peptide biosynthesis B2 protein [Armatimonadota bacterium]